MIFKSFKASAYSSISDPLPLFLQRLCEGCLDFLRNHAASSTLALSPEGPQARRPTCVPDHQLVHPINLLIQITSEENFPENKPSKENFIEKMPGKDNLTKNEPIKIVTLKITKVKRILLKKRHI